MPNDPVPSDQIDSYEILAKHYDAAYAAEQFQADVPFYVDLAKQSGGPVLEIACGTGRVLLNIAREGIPTDGIDNSPAMLRILRSNLEREPPHVRDRVGIHEGDMRSSRLNKKYPLVIIPFRPMQHMYTLRDQVDALTTAAAHLQNDGNLAFDVFYPKVAAIETGIGQEILDLEWPIDLARQRIVRRYFRKDSVDKIRQIFSGACIFRTYEGNALVLEETDALKLSYYTCPHLRALFLLAGLEVVEEYGSFTKALLDNEATQMIFIVRKASQIQAPSRNRQD